MKKLLVLATMIATALSCNNDESGTTALDDRELITISAISEFAADTDFQASWEASDDFDSRMTVEAAMPGCAAVTVETPPNSQYPRLITLNFGSGCTHNGILRSGALIITISAPVLENGSVMTIERDNYRINGYQIEGTVTFENQTTDPAIPQWTRTVSGGAVTNLQGDTFTHSGTRTVRLIAGASTILVPGDNVYEIASGTHSVMNPEGNTLTSTVVTPLIKPYSCVFLTQGVASLQGTNLNGQINYGDGDCDNQAVYTTDDGTSYNINL